MTTQTSVVSLPAQAATPSYSLWQLTAYALGLGTWGFGGPVALVGYMFLSCERLLSFGSTIARRRTLLIAPMTLEGGGDSRGAHRAPTQGRDEPPAFQM